MIIRLILIPLLLSIFSLSILAQTKVQSKLLESLPQEYRKEVKLTKQEKAELFQNYKGKQLRQELTRLRNKKLNKSLSKYRASLRRADLPEDAKERKAYYKMLRETSFNDGLSFEERKRIIREKAENRKQSRIDKN